MQSDDEEGDGSGRPGDNDETLPRAATRLVALLAATPHDAAPLLAAAAQRDSAAFGAAAAVLLLTTRTGGAPAVSRAAPRPSRPPARLPPLRRAVGDWPEPFPPVTLADFRATRRPRVMRCSAPRAAVDCSDVDEEEPGLRFWFLSR